MTCPKRTIIISGLPRSGTTWLAKIFDSHPLVLYRHEPDSYYLNIEAFLENERVSFYREALVQFTKELPNFRSQTIAGSMPFFSKRYYPVLVRNFNLLMFLIIKSMAKIYGDISLPKTFLPKSDYVLLWKTIDSSGRLSLYDKYLKNKRIVQIFRHPGGILSSMLRGVHLNKFGGYEQSRDYGLFALLSNTCVAKKYDLNYNKFMSMPFDVRLVWFIVLNMEMALNVIRRSSDCKLIIYEHLCLNANEIIGDLFSWCDLEFKKPTTSFINKSTSSHNNSYYSLNKNSRMNIDKWRSELSPEQIEMVQSLMDKTPLSDIW